MHITDWLDMLVAAEAGYTVTLSSRQAAATHRLTPRTRRVPAGSGFACRALRPVSWNRNGFA